MAKILITGSCGFVFSNFVLYLLQHTAHTIISVDKLTYAGSLMNISYNANVHNKRHKFYLGDVSDYDFMQRVFDIEKPDIVIHGAAESFVDKSIKGSQEFIKTNVVGTHAMLDAALNVHTPDLFINFSTDEVYGQIMNGSFKETDILNPRNPYSSSKASADLLGQSYFTTYGLPVITTRCCNIFGPRQLKEKFIPKIVTNILTNKTIPVYGAGNQVREWIYAKDVFYAVMSIIDKGKPGEIYNISSGEEKTNMEVLNSIIKIMGSGERLIEFVEDRLAHDFRYAVDNSKLKALGWTPKYRFDEAIEYTVGWIENNRWNWK